MKKLSRRGHGGRTLSWSAAALALVVHGAGIVAHASEDGPATWGYEETGGHLALEVPFTTPNRERIEVVSAYRYADPRVMAHDSMFREWRSSLPGTVDIVRVPIVWMRTESNAPSWKRRGQHRRVLLAARLLGLEDKVHTALLGFIAREPQALGDESSTRAFLVAHGMELSSYEAIAGSPALGALWWEGSTLSAAMQSARSGSDDTGGVPWLLVNGRDVTSSQLAGSAAAAFRTANRLIREAMESGPPYHHGATNIPELIDELEKWAGLHLTNVSGGRFKGVYNPWRRELWALDESGELRSVAREVEGEDAFWKWRAVKGPGTSYAMNWRAENYYAPREPKVRHGAFQFADWLSGGQVVELSFKQQPTGLSFAPNGKVEALSAQGPVRGSWWLEAANLHVSLGEYGIGSWSWTEAARQAGFEVSPASVTPWSRGATQFAVHGGNSTSAAAMEAETE